MKNWFLRRGYGSAKKQKELEGFLAVGVAATLAIILGVKYKKRADQRKEAAAKKATGFGGLIDSPRVSLGYARAQQLRNKTTTPADRALIDGLIQ